MQKTFFYTQIKTNDFDRLKKSCQPFSKDIFSADQEHIVAFEQPSHACRAALKFLNQVTDTQNKHEYKIVLVHGEFTQDRPGELPVRVARSIHQNSNPKNLIFTEEILNQINMSDIVFEQKSPLFVKALQKEIPTYALTRFEDLDLHVDPTDLFDFSHVDSYSTIDQVTISPNGEPIQPKDPFESSNTTLELDPIRTKVKAVTGKVTPAPHLAGNTGPIRPRPDLSGSARPEAAPANKIPTPALAPKPQFKSIAIILVLLVIVTFAGFYLAKSKPTPTTASSELPIPEIPGPETQTPTPTTNDPVASTATKTSTPLKELNKAPVAQVGYLNITSAPKGAEIWVNGKKLKNKTPLSNFKVTTMYPVEIEVLKSGYKKAVKKVNLAAQESQTVMFQLSATAPKDPKAAALAKAKALSNPKPAAKKKPTKKK